MATARLRGRVGAEASVPRRNLAILARPINALCVRGARHGATRTTLSGDTQAAVRALGAIEVGGAALETRVASGNALAQDALLADIAQTLGVIGAKHAAISRAFATQANHAVVVGHLVAICVGLARTVTDMIG